MQKIEKYDIFEIKLPGADARVELTQPSAVFSLGDASYEIQGFCENETEGIIRFMPNKEGVWKFKAQFADQAREGSFECISNTGNNHGPVVADGCHFRYADGERYIPMGTTCYAWVHQNRELVAQTIETLKTAPFNKIRMCVFPKSMPFNENEPLWFPFEKKADGTWDVSKPVSEFWKNLEDCIKQLSELGIESDLILFHPYDRWGFSTMSREDCLTYLDYCIRRLSAYRNIWWSLANEYQFLFSKTIEDWDSFGEKVANDDSYNHLIGVHNWVELYPKRPWLTHVSMQTSDLPSVFRARDEYILPVMLDEYGYEGNLAFDWGNCSGFEFMDRTWKAVCFGCYCTHGETFYRDDEVLWWAKGGKLYGETPKRLAYLHDLLRSLPGPMEPLASDAIRDPNAMSTSPQHAAFLKRLLETVSEKGREQIISELTKPIGRHTDYRLQYFGRTCPIYADVLLSENGSYKIETIDIWEMKRNVVLENASGQLRVPLPGKEGIAMLITRLSGDDL